MTAEFIFVSEFGDLGGNYAINFKLIRNFSSDANCHYRQQEVLQ
jgi:hypothetical protein